MSDDYGLKTTIQNANDYYIHYNAVNIGSRRYISIPFDVMKQQIIGQTKAQYKNKMLNSIQEMNPEALRVLSIAMQVDEDKFFAALNNEIRKKLELAIDNKALFQLYENVNIGLMQQKLQKVVQKPQETAKELSQVLIEITKALALIESGDGTLGAILLKVANGGLTTRSGIGGRLATELKKYSINNNYKGIQKESILSAHRQLLNFANALKSGKFKSGKKITADGLTKILTNNLISTSIAQALGVMNSAAVQGVLGKTFQSVGTKYVRPDSGNGPRITNKTDIKAEGVQISLSADGSENGGSFIIDIGISSKFYTGQGFRNPKDENNIIPAISIGSGSGGSLKWALDELFKAPVERYLVYNYITHNTYQASQINDLLAKKYILRLFATAGQGDFAQFMLINGELVSTWDIMNYALNEELKGSASQIQNDGTTTGKAVGISIQGRTSIYSANKRQKKEDNINAAWIRSHRVNSAISKAKIKAQLHVDKLLTVYAPMAVNI